MRSRYSAFAAGATDYLIATWHPRTRPHALDLDLARRWTRLDIHEATDDTVEFTAHSARGGYQETLHERSRFARRGGRWFYVDGDVVTDD